ncbi:MAG: nucleotidyltransferase domain-containing protein [Deltaproteobacteria bacterium]|nr:nucleotidyltransferase domain-containing protein [Deltaproteobacteria bacterium]
MTNRRMGTLTSCCKAHGIILAYLFGSQREAGKAYLQGHPVQPTAASDLDIGLVFKVLPEARMQAYGAIYADLARIFDPFPVDPIFLQETSYLFQFEAIKGELIYAESERDVDLYEGTVLSFASDISFHKETFEREVMEALEDGYFEIG